MSATEDALARARQHAPFLRRLAEQMPEIVERVGRGDAPSALAAARAYGDTADDAPRALRLERRALALAVALADLSGLISLEQVMAALSDFADYALHRAIRCAMLER